MVSNNHVIVHSTTHPIYINGHDYHFGHSYLSSSHKIRCSARLDDFSRNTVPFNTTFLKTNSTQLLDDIVETRLNQSGVNDSDSYQVGFLYRL